MCCLLRHILQFCNCTLIIITCADNLFCLRVNNEVGLQIINYKTNNELCAQTFKLCTKTLRFNKNLASFSPLNPFQHEIIEEIAIS